MVPGFLLPFGDRHSLLEPSCARCGIPPSLRSAYQAASLGPHRGCHVPHETDTTGVGALCTPGTVVRSRPTKFVRAAPAALSTAGPYLPLLLPIGGSDYDEASTRIHAIHPSGLPQPVTTGWNGSPWAVNLGLRTPQLPATHAEAGTVLARWTENYTIDISRSSFDEFCCTHATSCRTTWLIQEEPVGVKCIWKRGWRASQALIAGVLCVP